MHAADQCDACWYHNLLTWFFAGCHVRSLSGPNSLSVLEDLCICYALKLQDLFIAIFNLAGQQKRQNHWCDSHVSWLAEIGSHHLESGSRNAIHMSCLQCWCS